MLHTVPDCRYSSEPGAGEVAAGDAFDREHVQLLADHRAALDGGGDAAVDRGREHVVLHAELVEPPQAQLGQDAALVRDLAGQDVVVGADAVAGHHQDAVLADALA